jgi:hypothetical protein
MGDQGEYIATKCQMCNAELRTVIVTGDGAVCGYKLQS